MIQIYQLLVILIPSRPFQKESLTDVLQNTCAKNFTTFTGKHLCRILFRNRVETRGSGTGVSLRIWQNF